MDEPTLTDALRAYLAGDLALWRGFGPTDRRADVDAALGPPDQDADKAGNLAGSPTGYRTYPPSPAVPAGTTVWFEDDAPVLLRANGYLPTANLGDVPGEPELAIASQLVRYDEQWVWPARGLAAHWDEEGPQVDVLLGFSPMPADKFETSWVSRLAPARRIPRRG